MSDDTLCGGDGNDKLFGEEENLASFSLAGEGKDYLDGASGNDGFDIFAFKSGEGFASLTGTDVINNFKDFINKLDAGAAFENLKIFDIFWYERLRDTL